MTDSDQREIVSLREYLEHKLDAIEKRIDQRLNYEAQELMKQAARYDEHLEHLNGEQARLLIDRERYLQKEVHQPWKDEMDKWRDTVNKTLAATAARSTVIAAVCSAVVALVITVASALIFRD